MSEPKKLHILWTNGNIDTSLHMVMMYATNSMRNGWWDAITVIIWGAPTKLVCENTDVQQAIRKAMDAGVKFSTCVDCAKILGAEKKLSKLGVEILPWGMPLTKLLRGEGTLISV